MNLLLKQAQIFSKLVATGKKSITIEEVLEAQDLAKEAAETARKLYEQYNNQ